MNPDPATVVEPDEIFDHCGPVGHWGQVGFVKMGEPSDPIRSVYASDRMGGEIEVGDERMSLDEAEQYAARIVNAIRWQRAQLAEKRAAELNAMATGAAATHDWHQPDRSAECRRCRTVVRGGDELLIAGTVPTCGTPCPMGWHEIGTALSGGDGDGDAVCIFCKASWSAERLYVLMNREWKSLAVGPFLTYDQAIAISDVGAEFVPMPLLRDEALAAVAAGAAATAGLAAVIVGFQGVGEVIKTAADPTKLAEALKNLSPEARQRTTLEPAGAPDERVLAADAECRCVVSCADDPATMCSLSGEPHVHPDDGSDTFGRCPVHPDAPGDL